MPWVCAACEARHEHFVRSCASCYAAGAVRHVRASGDDPAKGPPTADNTPDDTTPPVRLGFWLDAFLGGGLPARCCWLLAGAPGGGKTSLAMQVCRGWPASKGQPLWISTEQPKGRVASYVRRLGVRGDILIYGSEADVTTARAVAGLAATHRARLVVVDSVTAMEAGAVKWLNRWAYRHDVAVVLVSQVNSDGDAAGGPAKRHDASMVATLRRESETDDANPFRWLRLDKSQHGEDGVRVRLVKTATGALALAPPLPPKADP